MTAETMPAVAAVRVSDLTKSYGRGEGAVTALRGVSLRVAPGEFLAIMGPSGSGKSSLLHVMAGLTTPTAGHVEVAGEDIFRWNDARLSKFRRARIGLVFQAYNLIPSLTVEDNLRLPQLLDGTATGGENLEELLAALGLSHRRHHRPDELSGGEQQRVAIGRALITKPAVVLADEPTGNLDSATTREMCELLLRLHRERSCTIVVVTHEPEVAIFAERVVVLRDGVIVGELQPADFENAQALGAAYHARLAAPQAEVAP